MKSHEDLFKLLLMNVEDSARLPRKTVGALSDLEHPELHQDRQPSLKAIIQK